jgi:hypothetical protein
MASAIRIRAVAALLTAMISVAAGAGVISAEATHNTPRDLSIHYSASKKAFKGKFKSPLDECRNGIVALHRVEPGTDPIVGSTTASGGAWSIDQAGHGKRYYVDSGSFQGPTAFCPDVRSPVLDT